MTHGSARQLILLVTPLSTAVPMAVGHFGWVLPPLRAFPLTEAHGKFLSAWFLFSSFMLLGLAAALLGAGVGQLAA